MRPVYHDVRNVLRRAVALTTFQPCGGAFRHLRRDAHEFEGQRRLAAAHALQVQVVGAARRR